MKRLKYFLLTTCILALLAAGIFFFVSMYHRSNIITFAGNDISDYSIYAGEENRALAVLIQTAIQNANEQELLITNVEAEKQIQINVDSALFTTDKDFWVEVSDGNLVINTWIASFAEEGILTFIAEYFTDAAGKDFPEGFSVSYNTDKIYYSDFGAVGNLDVAALEADISANPATLAGFTHASDADAIRNTHDAANQTGRHTVYADQGAVYYIPEIKKPIEIQTSCEFGNAEFYIDDRFLTDTYRSSNMDVFEVTNDMDMEKYNSGNDPYGIFAALKDGISKDADRIEGISLDYEAMLILYDRNVKMHKRTTSSATIETDAGVDQQDFVIIDKNGNVDPNTKLLFDYEAVTKVEVVRIDTKPISINGGIFTTVASRADGLYIQRGIEITRPNVTMDGFQHYVLNQPIESGGTDAGEGPSYEGFIDPRQTHNLQVKNAVLTGRSHYTGGSYDIGGFMSNQVVFTDCVQSNMFDVNGVVYPEKTHYWGIMGTNYCKNIELLDCVLSRFDAHSSIYNFKISGGEIAWIKVCGGGTGIIENVVIHNRWAFQLRDDYGCSFRGDIKLKNVILNAATAFDKERPVTEDIRYYGVCTTKALDLDFGYTIQVPNITIEDLSYVIYDYKDHVAGGTIQSADQFYGIIALYAGKQISTDNAVQGEDLVGMKTTIHPADHFKITYSHDSKEVLGTYKSYGGAEFTVQAVKLDKLVYGAAAGPYLVKEFIEEYAYAAD